MDKVMINKFVLRLFFVTHIFLTAQLPTDYLRLFNKLLPRLFFTVSVLGLVMYDVYATLLGGLVMIFANMEYLEREKIEKFIYKV